MAASRGPSERSRVLPALAVIGAALSLAACATAPPAAVTRIGAGEGRGRAYNRPYEVRGRWYTPADQPGYDKVGLASWYSYESRSRTTANGEPFDARLATAAHTTLPIPSWLEVTNLDNGRSARVRLNDRGPFVSGRILDLSRAAADELGFRQRGTARVRVRYLGPAEPLAGGARTLWASAPPPRRRPASPPRVLLAETPIPPPRPIWNGEPNRGPQDLDGPTPPVQTAGGAPPTLAEAEVDKDLADFGGQDQAPLVAESTAPRAAALASDPASEVRGGYAVQAGAFADRANAERAAVRLAEAGSAQVLPLERSDGEILYRVVIGEWPEAETADDARARIAALGFADAKVIGR